jgi:hypothetical protein
MKAIVQTEGGRFAVDLETEEVDMWDWDIPVPHVPDLALPRVVSAAASGSTIVAVVDRKPPLVISHDAGTTWREAGGGLPPGFAVAISEDDPDLVVYASRNRLHVSEDGGVFWRVLAAELPAIRRVALVG